MPASSAYCGFFGARYALNAAAKAGGANHPSPRSTRSRPTTAAFDCATVKAENHRKCASVAGAVQSKYSRANSARASSSESPLDGGCHRT